MQPKPKGAQVELLDGVTAPMPYMHPEAAKKFRELREVVKLATGFDFLAVCGDVLRTKDFHTTKVGVAEKSWHKTGRAFDYNQGDPRLIVEREDKGGRTYFRTYLKAKSGKKWDFTAAAERLGWQRIPAWTGWHSSWNKREFWHYQYNPQSLTWDEAMRQIYPPATSSRPVLKLNSTGKDVRDMQTALVMLRYLRASEVDGQFGPHTKAALEQFQEDAELKVDGICGPGTWAILNKLVSEK